MRRWVTVGSFAKLQEGLRLESGGRILIRAVGETLSIQRTGVASFCLNRAEVEWLQGVYKRALASGPVVHYQFRDEVIGACGRPAVPGRHSKRHDDVTCKGCISTIKFAEGTDARRV